MTPLQIVTVLVAMLSFGVYVQQELGIHTNGPKFGRTMHVKEIVQAPDDGQFICHSFIQSDKFHFISFHAPVWWKVNLCSRGKGCISTRAVLPGCWNQVI